MFLLSFVLPPFMGDGLSGSDGLFFEWFAIILLTLENPVFALPLLANLLYLLNCILPKSRINSKIKLSSLTIAFSLVSLGIDELPGIVGPAQKVTVGFGFFLWFSSFIVLLLGQLKLMKSKNPALPA